MKRSVYQRFHHGPYGYCSLDKVVAYTRGYMWWTAGTTRGGAGHLGLTHAETQRGRLWTT